MPKYIDFDALGVQSCNPDVFVNKGYAEGWNSLMRMLYDAPAADVEPKQKWIPVTKRKPEPVTAKNRRKTEPVLLYSPKGGYYIGWYYGVDWQGNDKYLNRTSRDSRQYITTKVTHWMPLFQPPKEDDA